MSTKKNGVYASSDPTSIGNVLVEMGAITLDELIDAVIKQNETRSQLDDALLGQILIGNKRITPAQLDIATIKQAELRKQAVNYQAALSLLVHHINVNIRHVSDQFSDIANLARSLLR